MTKLQEDIQKLEKSLKSPATPEAMRPRLEAALKALKEQEPKPVAKKKTTTPKKASQVRKGSETLKVVDGVDLRKLVKFKKILEPGDEKYIYQVISYNDGTGRVIIEPINSTLSIPPQNTVSVKDIVNVEPIMVPKSNKPTEPRGLLFKERLKKLKNHSFPANHPIMILDEDSPQFKSAVHEYFDELELADEIIIKGDAAWEATGVQSGADIRLNEKLTAKFAKVFAEGMKELGVEKHSLSETVYDKLADVNAHLYNEFLAWNGYYNKKTEKQLRAMYTTMYENAMKEHGNSTHAANPAVINISEETPEAAETLLQRIKKDPAYKDIDFGSTNIEIDAKRKAKGRGKRTSKDGNTYYENRENRSDHKTDGDIYLDSGGILREDGKHQTFANYNGHIPYGSEARKTPKLNAAEKEIIMAVYENRLGAAKFEKEKESVNDDIKFLKASGTIFDFSWPETAKAFLAELDALPYTSRGKKVIKDRQVYYDLYEKLDDFWRNEEYGLGGRTKAAHNKDHKYQNKDEAYEAKYAKNHPGRERYKKTNSKPGDKRSGNGNALFSKAKEIRQPGEAWQDALKRAKLLI